MDKLNIKISLANRLYPMNILGSEEKIIRLSSFKIEKMLKVLKEKYSVKDDQDLLAMCALQLCVKLEKSYVHRKEIEATMIDNICDINEEISGLV